MNSDKWGSSSYEEMKKVPTLFCIQVLITIQLRFAWKKNYPFHLQVLSSWPSNSALCCPSTRELSSGLLTSTCLSWPTCSETGSTWCWPLPGHQLSPWSCAGMNSFPLKPVVPRCVEISDKFCLWQSCVSQGIEYENKEKNGNPCFLLRHWFVESFLKNIRPFNTENNSIFFSLMIRMRWILVIKNTQAKKKNLESLTQFCLFFLR